jgi:2-oxo-4-hydroxy-4-carboxy--5-ureidoimidazoline (OHCU) decarboxylase
MKAMDLDHDMLLDAARLMENQGGSFAEHIARAFYCADSTNRVRLLTAFDDLFCKYYRQHRLNESSQGEME